LLQSALNKCEGKARLHDDDSKTMEEQIDARLVALETELQDANQALALCRVQTQLSQTLPDPDLLPTQVITIFLMLNGRCIPKLFFSFFWVFNNLQRNISDISMSEGYFKHSLK